MIQKAITALCALTIAACAHAQMRDATQLIGEKLDSQLFAAYNSCNLKSFGDLLASDVEFYHDKGGLMLGRQLVVDAVKENICEKARRELTPGTLVSYPMDNYGIVQLGEHRFCTIGTDKCNGVAKFVHLWRKVNDTWQATRIISYDHNAL